MTMEQYQGIENVDVTIQITILFLIIQGVDVTVILQKRIVRVTGKPVILVKFLHQVFQISCSTIKKKRKDLVITKLCVKFAKHDQLIIHISRQSCSVPTYIGILLYIYIHDIIINYKSYHTCTINLQPIIDNRMVELCNAYVIVEIKQCVQHQESLQFRILRVEVTCLSIINMYIYWTIQITASFTLTIKIQSVIPIQTCLCFCSAIRNVIIHNGL